MDAFLTSDGVLALDNATVRFVPGPVEALVAVEVTGPGAPPADAPVVIGGVMFHQGVRRG